MNSKHLMHNLNPCILAVLFTFLCSLSLNLHSAEVYKWIDDNGEVHYSDRKPNNTSAESLRIRTQKNLQLRKNPIEQAASLDEKQNKALEAKAQKLQRESKKRELNAQCQAIKNNLKTLMEKSRVRIEEEGKLRYLTPDEINKKKTAYQQQIKEFCS